MSFAALAPRQAARRGLVGSAAFVVAAAFTLASLDPRWRDPWPWILLAWFLVAAVVAWGLRHVPLRVAAVHLAAVFLALAGFERWLLLTTGGVPAWGSWEGRTTTGFFTRPDALLGYVPARNASTRSRREKDGRIAYDVTNTIGADGFRVTPSPVAQPPEGSLLVFGCSFAFGEGLNDGETLPWRLAEETGRRFFVRNLGFPGYGPHQMLALVEGGRALSGVPRARPVTVFYEALADHVPRALGRRPWSRGTPRYVPAPAGGVLRDGAFGESDPALEKWISWRRILGSERRITGDEVALAAAIVVRARDLVQRSDPAARFEVLYWDEEDDLSRAYRLALASSGFPIHDVSRALPGYPARRGGWQIVDDGHPTAAANARLAGYLARGLSLEGDGGAQRGR